jgi:hypothetical protein
VHLEFVKWSESVTSNVQALDFTHGQFWYESRVGRSNIYGKSTVRSISYSFMNKTSVDT